MKLPIELIGKGAQAFLESVRERLDLGDVTGLRIEGHEFEDRETILHLSFTQDFKVEDPELGQVSGVYLEYPGRATLRFDREGGLKEYEVLRPTKETAASTKADIKRLIQQGGIHIAQPGELVVTGGRIGQDFAVITDQTGKRRLLRIRFT